MWKIKGNTTIATKGEHVTPQEIEALAFQHMPDAFFRGVLQAVFQAHEVAKRDCAAAFADTEAVNVLATTVEASLRATCAMSRVSTLASPQPSPRPRTAVGTTPRFTLVL